MLIGIVGLPNAGKSTFFKACTLSDVLIASYPFATIKPNHGIAYVKIDCIEKEFNVKCNPQRGYCINGKRFVPVELIDVAGLVEGASEGKGLGNQFLDDLTSADALIHVVDMSGETDKDGRETKGYNPVKDIEILEKELDLWYFGILKKVWRTFSRTVQNTKEEISKAVARQFSGLKVKEDDIKRVLLTLKYNEEKPADWSEEQLLFFANKLRHISKPMIIAANKMDKKDAKKNLELLRKAYPDVRIIPCSADYELTLREAHNKEFISYLPGESNFEILKKLTDKQKNALENIKDFLKEHNTGVQDVLNTLVFDVLEYLAVFPASANKLVDSKGNLLPDCFLLKKGSTALDFAFTIHSDLGENFIKAIDARTKKALGKEYKLKNRDALEIVIR